MSTVQSAELIFESRPFFAAHWLGCHPFDQQPRLVQCFGPSHPDEHASGWAAELGLESVILGNPPPLTSVTGAVEGERLVLSSHGRELLRSDPLPLALAKVLQWRAEVLMVWVDFPLQDPRAELAVVGLEHVWTGIALVQGE